MTNVSPADEPVRIQTNISQGAPPMNPMMQAMQQLQLMQQKVAEAQQKISTMSVTEETGGGAVKVTVTGNGTLTDVTIAAEAIDPEDRETLEDLVLTAVNKALESSRKMAENEMKAATEGLMPDLPGLPGMNLPF